MGTYVLLGTACAWLLIQLARKPRDGGRATRSTRERHRAAGRGPLAIGAGMTLYALLGGADFGGGVWDLLAQDPRASASAP